MSKTTEISRTRLEAIATHLEEAETVRGHDWANTGAPVAVISVMHPATFQDGPYFELVEVHASPDNDSFYVARDSVLGLEDKCEDHMKTVKSVMDCAVFYGNTVRHTVRTLDAVNVERIAS